MKQNLEVSFENVPLVEKVKRVQFSVFVFCANHSLFPLCERAKKGKSKKSKGFLSVMNPSSFPYYSRLSIFRTRCITESIFSVRFLGGATQKAPTFSIMAMPYTTILVLFSATLVLAVTCPTDNPFCQCNLCSDPTSEFTFCENTPAFDLTFGTAPSISTFNPLCGSLPLTQPAGQTDPRRWNPTPQGNCSNSFFLPTQFSETSSPLSCGNCEVCQCAPPKSGQYGQKQINIGLCCDTTNGYGGAGCQCQQNGLSVTSGFTYGPGQICSGGQDASYCTVNGYYFPNPSLVVDPVNYVAYQNNPTPVQNWPWVEFNVLYNYNTGVAQQYLPKLYSFLLQLSGPIPNAPTYLGFDGARHTLEGIPYYIGVGDFNDEGYIPISAVTSGSFGGFPLQGFPYYHGFESDTGIPQGINIFSYDSVMQRIFWANESLATPDIVPQILCAYCFNHHSGPDTARCDDNLGTNNQAAMWSGDGVDWNDPRCNYWRIINFDPLSPVSDGVQLAYDPPSSAPTYSMYPPGCLSAVVANSKGTERMSVQSCTNQYTYFTLTMTLPISDVDAEIITFGNWSGAIFPRGDPGFWFTCPGGNTHEFNCNYWITLTQSTQANTALSPLFQNCDVCSVCVCPGTRPETGFDPTTGVGFCCPPGALPLTDSDFACSFNAIGSGGAYGSCVPSTGKVCAGNGNSNYGLGGTGCVPGAPLQCVCLPEYIGPTCNFRLSSVCGDPACSDHGTCSYSYLTGSFLCTCIQGYQGTYCEWPIPQCVYQLNGTVCSNQGTCLNTGGFGEPTCVCNPAYAGLYCEYSTVTCVEQTTQTICANRGVCEAQSMCGNGQRRSVTGSECITTPTSFDICLQQAPVTAINGYAASFGVIGANGITNVGLSNVCLNIGIGPLPAIVNDQGDLNYPGLLHQADDLYNAALTDAYAFYNEYVTSSCTTTYMSGVLAGPVTLDVGVYCFPNGATISGPITLTNVHAYGLPTIFIVTGNLVTASGTSITVSGTQPIFTTTLVTHNINVGAFSQIRGTVYSLLGNIVLNQGYTSSVNSLFYALAGTASLSTVNIVCETGSPFCGRVYSNPVTLLNSDTEYTSQTLNLAEIDCILSFGSQLRGFAVLNWQYTQCIAESQYTGPLFIGLLLNNQLSLCPIDTGTIPYSTFLRLYFFLDSQNPYVITKRCYLVDASVFGSPPLLDEVTYTNRVGDTTSASPARVQNEAMETECQAIAIALGSPVFMCDTIFNQCYLPSAVPYTSVTRVFQQADASNPLAHVYWPVGTGT